MYSPKVEAIHQCGKVLAELRRLAVIYYEYNRRMPTDADLPIATMTRYAEGIGMPNGDGVCVSFDVQVDGRPSFYITLELHPKPIQKVVLYEKRKW